jgi:hypothetical protein
VHRPQLLNIVTVNLFLVPAFALGATHYIAANGSDSNNGTTKTTAWLHAPGMPNCASNCASYTPAAGDSIIFRGGDTWHTGNSSASPYTGGMWSWSWSGSSSSFIYIGVDQTWYTGLSWVRPIITGDNSTSTNAVSSCAYQAGSNNVLVRLYPIRYITFDNFELTGLCWNTPSGNPGGTFVWFGGAVPGYQNPFNIQNLYLHGWTHTTAGTQGGGAAFSGYNQNYGVTIQYNVVDGSDSDDQSLDVFSSDSYITQYNVIRHVGGTSVSNDCHILHDNLFEYINNVSDGSTHTDVYMCYGEANDGANPADGTPNLFYNNVFRYIGTEYSGAVSSVLWQFPPSGYTDYTFNNVFHDYYGMATNYNNFCEGGGCGNMAFFNNTEEASLPDYTGCIICNGQASGSVISSVNNHWITAAGTSPNAVFQSTTTVAETSALYQTISVANGQGYNSANDFAPTTSSNATVTMSGTNETIAFCAAFTDSTAVAYCESGTRNGCTYLTATHSVSCPAITAGTRPPTGSWNVGAYQFSSNTTGTGGTLSPSTNLIATAH